jgi:serine/threonine-protein kinase
LLVIVGGIAWRYCDISLKKEKYPIRKYQPHIPEQVIKIAKRAIRADRNNRFQNCLQFRQALQKIPLAVEWFPIDNDNWQGTLKNETFDLNLYSKRTGYFIDFKRNGRKINNRCCAGIDTEETARQEFFKTIRETTINV